MQGPPSGQPKTGVLFISSAEHPGADTFIHNLIMRSLDRARFDVHVACSAGAPGTPTPSYRLLREIPDLRLRPANFGPSLSGRSGLGKVRGIVEAASAATGFLGLARYTRKHRITVLHATDRPRDAVACAVLGKMTGARSIIHAHLKCADWMSKPLRWSMGRVDALVAVSDFVSGSLVANGYASARTHTVLNAIDVPAWDPALDGAAARRGLGISVDAPVIACAARLFRGKGQDDVIRALPSVCEEFPGVRLLIIGREDRQATPMGFAAELEKLAKSLGVAENVIFTGHREDMPALMAACDVFALPSYEEPFGLVFIEAMAMKKPVVALHNGGAPEVVEHGKSGLLSQFGDGPALAGNLRTLLRDPALRARFGEYGRRQVEARFTAERMAADVGRVYSSLSPARASRVVAVADGAGL